MMDPFSGKCRATPSPALVTVMQAFVYKCPRPYVPPPSVSAPQLSPLPGVHTPEDERLMECERRPGFEPVWDLQRPKDWQPWEKKGKCFQAHSRHCTGYMAGVLVSSASLLGGKVCSLILQLQKLSPLPESSGLNYSQAHLPTSACLLFHRPSPLPLKSLPFAKPVSHL
ncbi:hypothetical protein HJG60_008982 [Phyllostomus discolor]|uniref:Uncharacterized protein n=1 Tax=Phyllostomus discolor TaxID=89673 RepID=A0A833YLX9_9CHIR|nr:hypothetical protein HJG60_008982 [Phyllostomus discolor]